MPHVHKHWTFALANRAVLLLMINAHMTSAQQSPEQVVDSAFRAIAGRNWIALRELMDSSALTSARQEQLGMLILVEEQRRARQRVGGGYNPQDVVIADHLATVGNVKAPRFGKTIAELAALSPADFYVRWLDAAYAPGRANAVEDIVDRTRIIIGSLTAGDTAWVLYRKDSQWQEREIAHVTSPGSVEILPLRRLDGRWRILPNFELAHGPDITDMFDDSPMRRRQSAPTRREVTQRPVSRPGPPRYANATPSPTLVVDSAFEALARRDWPRLAMLVDSQTLMEFQARALQELVVMLKFQKMRSGNSRSTMMTFFSLGDSDVANARQERVDLMQGHPTIGQLESLSPAEFFERWCEAAYASPSPTDVRPERHYLGIVFEGEDLAHVLYHSSNIVFDQPAQVLRMPLRFSDGHWRIQLNEEIGDFSALSMRFLR